MRIKALAQILVVLLVSTSAIAGEVVQEDRDLSESSSEDRLEFIRLRKMPTPLPTALPTSMKAPSAMPSMVSLTPVPTSAKIAAVSMASMSQDCSEVGIRCREYTIYDEKIRKAGKIRHRFIEGTGDERQDAVVSCMRVTPGRIFNEYLSATYSATGVEQECSLRINDTFPVSIEVTYPIDPAYANLGCAPLQTEFERDAYLCERDYRSQDLPGSREGISGDCCVCCICCGFCLVLKWLDEESSSRRHRAQENCSKGKDG